MSLRKGNILISGVGIDGVSPSASVSKSGSVTTISITDKDGTTTAQVLDGQNGIEPTVINNSDSTYTISSLTGHYVYNLGEITALTISATTTFYIETLIYLTSGNTSTTVTLPDTLTHIGDAPIFTTSNNISTGTLAENKSYIVSILNDIAIWKEY